MAAHKANTVNMACSLAKYTASSHKFELLQTWNNQILPLFHFGLVGDAHQAPVVQKLDSYPPAKSLSSR